MEAVLLDLVLSGAIELDQILPWTLSRSGELPQGAAAKLSEHLEADKAPMERQPQAAYFRDTVLNTVRRVPTRHPFPPIPPNS